MKGDQIIENGVYLVVDPAMDENELLAKIEVSVAAGIVALQVWDNFTQDQSIEALLLSIFSICKEKNVPVLINNRWQYLNKIPLSGIHFDSVPDNLKEIKHAIARPILIGVTCNNDLQIAKLAAENEFDYISFCSIFPSKTATSCDLVTLENVKAAREIFDKSIFLAGGITPSNMDQLVALDYNGVVAISGIMNSAKPAQAVKEYKEKLRIRYETNKYR